MIDIREPTREERAAWLPLWQGYLDFYEATLSPEMTDLTWNRLHDPAESLSILAAYRASEMVGFAIFLFHRSSWAPEGYCYLEDLFVADIARGQGVGRKLIETVKTCALATGSSRLYWNTRVDNHAARTLYERIAGPAEFVEYRIALP